MRKLLHENTPCSTLLAILFWLPLLTLETFHRDTKEATLERCLLVALGVTLPFVLPYTLYRFSFIQALSSGLMTGATAYCTMGLAHHLGKKFLHKRRAP